MKIRYKFRPYTIIRPEFKVGDRVIITHKCIIEKFPRVKYRDSTGWCGNLPGILPGTEAIIQEIGKYSELIGLNMFKWIRLEGHGSQILDGLIEKI